MTNAIVKSAQQALDSVTPNEMILQVAKAIQLMAGTDDHGNPKLTADMALATAIYQAGTGQLLNRDFYIDPRMGRIEGYRGVARDASDRNIGPVQIKYRQLSAAEGAENGLDVGDIAVICEVYQLVAWEHAKRLGVRYAPVEGVGIIKEVEMYDAHEWKESNSGKKYKAPLPREQWKPIILAGGMTWYKKAKNRAYKDALRHVPGLNESYPMQTGNGEGGEYDEADITESEYYEMPAPTDETIITDAPTGARPVATATATPAPATDALIAKWQAEQKNFTHAPMPANGNWGATQQVLTGICGSGEERHRFMSLLFGRQIASANDLTAQEAAWLQAFVKARKAGDSWAAEAQAEQSIASFMQRHPAPVDFPAADDLHQGSAHLEHA